VVLDGFGRIALRIRNDFWSCYTSSNKLLDDADDEA